MFCRLRQSRRFCANKVLVERDQEVRDAVRMTTIQVEALRTKKTVALARGLLGKHLVRRFADGRIEARLITEVEAYHGEGDLACHARVGRTARTEVMYAPGGVWYVYLCYGIHQMLNLVVGPRDWPAAVLIRGVEGVSGPGRVTKALQVDRRLNGAPAAEVSGLWIEDRGVRVPRRLVRATPRIGVDYAGPVWAKKRWRFVLTGTLATAGPAKANAPRAARRTRKSKSSPGRV